MTATYPHQVPPPLAEGWTVTIDMPHHTTRRHAGTPVGWLSLNTIAGGVGGAIGRWRTAQAWRQAAYHAYQRAHLPTGLDRIYVLVQLRFPDRGVRDPANYELTVKPVLDALQPTTHHTQRDRRGQPKLVVNLGHGVIPGDDPRYLVRGPEQPVAPPLGRKNPIKGQVIVTVIPLPPAT